MYQGILGQKDQEVDLKSKQIVPYFGNGTKTSASSSHSHEKPIACLENCQGKVRLKVDEVRQLCRRLDILEKDTQLMKKLFFGNVEERQELLKEISHHLQTIEEHLRHSTAKGKQQKVTSMINAAKFIFLVCCSASLIGNALALTTCNVTSESMKKDVMEISIALATNLMCQPSLFIRMYLPRSQGQSRDAGLPQVLNKEENIAVVTNRKVVSNDFWACPFRPCLVAFYCDEFILIAVPFYATELRLGRM
ncbi:hypothetical protein ACLOJK_035859 [Asimina triloba]